MESLTARRDPRISEWGPYSKDYAGISHVTDRSQGLRFDLMVAPGVFRNKILIPNVMYESGFHPTEASADLSYFSNRHQVEWKDQVFCDISFSPIGESSRLIRCECVNRTDILQSLSLHYMASMQAYNLAGKLNGIDPLRSCKVETPEGVWVDALDYSEIHYTNTYENERLISGGYYRGEVRGHGFTSGAGVRFGRDRGDAVRYHCAIEARAADAAELVLRYKSPERVTTLKVELQDAQGEQVWFSAAPLQSGEAEFQLASLSLDSVSPGAYTLQLTADGNALIELDGWIVLPAGRASELQFIPDNVDFNPAQYPGPDQNSILLKYEGADTWYGIKWLYEPAVLREVHHAPLDEFMRIHSRRNATNQYNGNGLAHYTEVYLRPVNVEPQSSRVVYGMVCSGTREEVIQQLAAFYHDDGHCERMYVAAKDTAVKLPSNREGESYRFSQERMAAVLMQNVVYPIYVRREYVRHFTPGRFWDSLYTWDSGFIGLGMCEFAVDRAVDVLNTYVMEPGDPHAAFLHHGSMVPVQHYLFLELWNKTRSNELLAYFYPRLRTYYLFYAGHSAGSTMRRFTTGMLNPFAYFYNSGGWDDYPPQHHLHSTHTASRAAPAVNTSHGIRIAKMLSMAARHLGGLDDDVAMYEADIAHWTEMLQQHAWDEESGYFGYVMHDESGRPEGLLRREDGENYNKGLDGVLPLVAGVVTAEQEERITSHLFNPSELWSNVGLSTVDQSASYYRNDGYWNGCVWMPHQWFIWKSLLDFGRGELAERIARTALEVWKRTVEHNYNTAEHIMIETEKGGGWHHFGGLSSPVVNWFAAMYRPGTVTAGFDVWFQKVEISSDLRSVEIELIQYNERPSVLLLVLDENHGYEASTGGEPLPLRELHAGTVEIRLPEGKWQGTIRVTSA